MRASFALIAAIAAPTYAMVAGRQDSSSFLQDTAPQAPQAQPQDSSNFLQDTAPQVPSSIANVISQISDGQPQAPTVAPPGLPMTDILPPAVTSALETPPVSIPSVDIPSVFLPVESLPLVATSLSVVEPPALTTAVIPTPSIVPPGVSPNGTLPVAPTTAAAPSNTGSTNAPEATPSDTGAASSVQAFSTFGLVAAMAAIFLA